MRRKLFLASSISAALAGCSAIGTKLNDNPKFHAMLESAERWNEAVIGTRGRARLYRESDVSRNFPVNSLDTPGDAYYQRLANERFRGYALPVGGQVDRPLSLSLAQLRRMMHVTQITRHDCVEGWSAIAQWQGVRLADVIALAGPRADARYVVFHTFDRDSDGAPYYESLNLHEAAHPQTILALVQNGAPIAPDRGAPVRLVVPTQLGYKSAKWVQRIEIAASLAKIGGGNGGYWEDQGYEWYAGI